MAVTEPSAEDLGLRLGCFELERMIGSGAMAQVWRARHRAFDTLVAVKVMTAHSARDAEFLRCFEREVRAVAALQHPSIATVYDTGLIERSAASASGGDLVAGSPWMAMEFANRGPLSTQMPRDWRETLNLLLDVLDGLAHAHARGVLHLDVKPDNLLVTGVDRRHIVADFGLAHMMNDETGRVLARAGTPAYMAPEQVRGHWAEFGPWTDLYALGCVVYEVVCGRPPFEGQDPHDTANLHLSGPPPKFAPRFPVPPDFEAWLRKLMAREITDRFTSAAQATWRLSQIVDLGVTNRVSLSIAPGRYTDNYRSLGAQAPLPLEWMSPRPCMPLLPSAGLGLFGLRVGPFVGRVPTRDRLWATLHRVAGSGQARTTVIDGPAGCGKTRLVQWLTWRAAELGGTTTVRFGPDIVWSATRREHEILRLHEMAWEQPIIVWFEDADVEAAHFAAHLTEASLDVPLMIVVTARDFAENAANQRLTASPHVEVIRLEALRPREHRQLVDELIGLAPELARQVAAHTQGQPRYARQLVGEWINRGVLQETPLGYTIEKRSRAPFPKDLDALFAMQIDQVARRSADPARARLALYSAVALAQGGKAIRRKEWAAVVLRLCNGVDHVLEGHLAHAGLIGMDRDGWHFVDPRITQLLRRAAIAESAWVRVNEAALSVVPDIPDEALRRVELQLAAGHESEAIATLHGAVKTLMSSGRHRRGLTAMARLDALLDSLDVMDIDLEIESLRADMMRGLGVGADDALPSPAVPPPTPAERIDKALRDAHRLLDNGEIDAAVKAYEGARDDARAARLHTRRAWALVGLAEARLATLQLSALFHAESAVARFVHEDDREGHAAALRCMGVAEQLVGNHDKAVRALTQARTMWTSLGSAARYLAAIDLGFLSLERGAVDEAAATFDQLVRVQDHVEGKYRPLVWLGVAAVAAERGDRSAWTAASQLYSTMAQSQAGPHPAHLRAPVRMADAWAENDQPDAAQRCWALAAENWALIDHGRAHRYATLAKG